LTECLNVSTVRRNLTYGGETHRVEPGPGMTDTADRLYERLLVLRCQAGDKAAFVELVERFEPRMRYYLRKMLRDAHVVEDVVQDVWVDVFRAVSRLADVDAFRAWLYRIAHDRAVRELRKRRPAHLPLLEVELIDESAS